MDEQKSLMFVFARLTRLALVRAMHQNDILTTEEATMILSGVVDPEDSSSVRDDSDLLTVEDTEIEKLITDGRFTEVIE